MSDNGSTTSHTLSEEKGMVVAQSELCALLNGSAEPLGHHVAPTVTSLFLFEPLSLPFAPLARLLTLKSVVSFTRICPDERVEFVSFQARREKVVDLRSETCGGRPL